MSGGQPARPGPAVTALLAIGVVTAGWWALALWPAGAAAAEWLTRTRAACFGAVDGGLPDTAGWIVLVGQPLGMVALLIAVWGDALRTELGRLVRDPRGRLAAGVLVLAGLGGTAWAGQRVVAAQRIGTGGGAGGAVLLTRGNVDASRLALTDQLGRRGSPVSQPGRSTLVTFAFGHCEAVCPTLVRELLAARRQTGRSGLPLVIVTLDPWRDTPERLPALAAGWGLQAGDRVLSGSVAEVEQVLKVLGVGRRRDERTGSVEHGGTVMLLDARGHIAWRLDAGWDRVSELLLKEEP